MSRCLVREQPIDRGWDLRVNGEDEVTKSIEKNVVLRSIESDLGNLCIDIFIRPDGTHGFEEFRRDVEDAGRWHSLNRFGSLMFASEADAMERARRDIAWLQAVDG